MRTLWVALTTCLFVLPGHAKYSGGSGTTDDPYQIATVADLLALGSSPEDYSRHFVLMADIDLDPNLPGRRVFGKAVIAPGERAYDSNDESHFVGVPFTGVFDGNDHVVSHLVISGTEHLGLFGQLASGAQVKGIGVVDVRVVGTGSHVGALAGSTDSSPTQGGVVVWCYSTGVVQGTWQVGGLVGESGGTITHCYSTTTAQGAENVGGLVGGNNGSVTGCYAGGAVSGTDEDIGGLAGANEGDIADCYSTGAVRGDEEAGGLVGSNRGVVTDCYSTGAVYSNGDDQIGGLVGSSRDAVVMFSFWDIVTSGRAWSDGGIGLTTAQMWEAHTFLDAGWDFVGETANGTEDIWRMQEQDYPQLAWEPLVKAAFEGFESGQFSAMGWRHAGDLPWQVTSAQRHSGQYSARSGAISHGQTSTLRITCPCSAGTFSFLFKTSTESGDKLTFKVDGQQKAAWSGSSNWKKAMLVVAAGMHTFEWSYVKDASVSAGQDTVWIDEVVFP